MGSEGTPEDTAAAENKKIYQATRDELSKRQLSNAENLDKSILTYSSAGLALSLGYLKDIAGPGSTPVLWPLYCSWFFFIIAIICVITSYPLGQKIISIQLDRATRAYLLNEEDAHKEHTRWEQAMEWLTLASGVVFVVALIMTTTFVIVNLRENDMSNVKHAGKPATTRGTAQDAATGLSMQPPAPAPQPKPAQPTEASSQQGGGSGTGK